MPPFAPVKRAVLIRALRKSGYEGLYSGGSHEYMIRGQQKVFIPNPHEGDIGKGLLLRILRQAGISKDEWEAME
jgi:predicted RNA binding protein YcfA (HicA-like mRNA interferase family)